MKVRIVVTLASALALGLILSGCGGGGDSSSSADTLTKAEFITQADAICVSATKELDKASQDVDPNSDEDANQFVEKTVIPNLEDQFAQLRALGTPEGDNGELNAMLTSGEAAIDEIKKDPSVALDGEPFAHTNQLAKSYGLQECGKS